MAQSIMFEVSDAELDRILFLKDGKTWRELILEALGVQTERRDGARHPRARRGVGSDEAKVDE